MASLDTAREQVVIRLVYDGPPLSGKTTSLRSLAGSLSRQLITPEEAEGRTLLFDWVDYVGGRFEGYDIRCQIVSVPGQAALAGRRRHLLAEADAVVFVADTTRDGLGASLDLLADLRSDLAGRPGPPTGVVLQANKRDLPDAVPSDDFRRRLGEGEIAVIESVASEGESIRHAFVLAVRLALDRVRVLLREGRLASGPGRVDSAAELVDDLLAAEAQAREAGVLAGGAGDVAGEALREAVALEESATRRMVGGSGESGGFGTAGDVPPAPDATVPGGLIWPPVDGRAVLHEAATAGIVLDHLSDGGWVSQPAGGRWTVQSFGSAVYDDLEQGRNALLAWAQVHSAEAAVLSPGRALVLTETGTGGWRLWQILRRERSLADLLAEALGDGPPEEVANRLAASARLLLRASGTFPHDLDVTLRSVGLAGKRAVLVEPMPTALRDLPRRPIDVHQLLRSELASFLRGVTVGPSYDLPRVLRRLGQLSDRGCLTEPLVKLLVAVLIKHL